jgi:hypothetical protein
MVKFVRKAHFSLTEVDCIVNEHAILIFLDSASARLFPIKHARHQSVLLIVKRYVYHMLASSLRCRIDLPTLVTEYSI